MCDVTFSPKSWENCYVTVQDYRRRFTEPYYFEFGLERRLSLFWTLLLINYCILLFLYDMLYPSGYQLRLNGLPCQNKVFTYFFFYFPWEIPGKPLELSAVGLWFYCNWAIFSSTIKVDELIQKSEREHTGDKRQPKLPLIRIRVTITCLPTLPKKKSFFLLLYCMWWFFLSKWPLFPDLLLTLFNLNLFHHALKPNRTIFQPRENIGGNIEFLFKNLRFLYLCCMHGVMLTVSFKHEHSPISIVFSLIP